MNQRPDQSTRDKIRATGRARPERPERKHVRATSEKLRDMAMRGLKSAHGRSR